MHSLSKQRNSSPMKAYPSLMDEFGYCNMTDEEWIDFHLHREYKQDEDDDKYKEERAKGETAKEKEFAEEDETAEKKGTAE
ncbi:hypothetical protein DAPPUDRAFT_334693 [Daphnia pulex]|uniref:Uncharacterized protein n=1 Tax=Daphnia pulex TaxID=6669 RepID=E9HW73_DAPPU|nr:hypothetical protein DAPPUDRAFT_334693 [Daphnia pulex]|eukprot:EFX64007.1 hypothetical protein DAPPUDRAFT_334693 [Daphnia pulex]